MIDDINVNLLILSFHCFTNTNYSQFNFKPINFKIFIGGAIAGIIAGTIAGILVIVAISLIVVKIFCWERIKKCIKNIKPRGIIMYHNVSQYMSITKYYNVVVIKAMTSHLT